MSPELEPALDDQVAALEHLEKALQALAPPDGDRNQEQQEQQQSGDQSQAQQQPQPSEQEQMSQRQALRRLQSHSRREAERQRRRANPTNAGARGERLVSGLDRGATTGRSADERLSQPRGRPVPRNVEQTASLTRWRFAVWRLSILVTFAAWAVPTAAATLSLSVSSESIHTGMPFTLTLQAEGFQEEPAPAAPPLAIAGLRSDLPRRQPQRVFARANHQRSRSEWREVKFNYQWRVVAKTPVATRCRRCA